jgi:hypothetical protein
LDGGTPSKITATGLKPQDRIVGTIRKNKREEIRVGLRTFNDDRMCDLRVYKNVNGVEIGTSQGLPFRPCNIRQLIDLLELVLVAAETEGLQL